MFLINNRVICLLIVMLLILTGISALGCAEAKNTSKNGIKRHPDSIHDADGILHKVWQEPVDGTYQIFYVRQGDKKEMGIGSDNNPSYQLTDTPYDSTWPKIAYDSSSGIIYIIWKEYNPASDVDTEYEVPGVPSMMYTATMPEEDDDNGPAFTLPQNLADGSQRVTRFAVSESQYQIQLKETKELRGILDTDKDTIPDYEEVIGTKGYVTNWRLADTDEDGLLDNMEYRFGFNPVYDDSQSSNADLFFHAILMTSDNDLDGLTFGEERDGSFPVTVGVANIRSGGHATYRFYPMDDYSATLSLEVLIKRWSYIEIPPPAYSSYSLTVTVNSEELDPVELTKTGTHMEWERFKVDIGPFDVFQDAETDIQIDVSLSAPPSKESSNDINNLNNALIIGPYWFRILEISSLMIKAPSPDYHMFSYKEGRDFLPDESESTTEGVKDFEISSDPWRADLFIEIDFLEGHEMPPELYSEVINAYSDAGIILHYKIDEKNIPQDTETDPDDDDDGARILRNGDELLNFLADHRNEDYDEYIHLIIARRIWAPTLPGWIYGIAKSADTADDLTHSGIVIADTEILLTAPVESSVFEKRLKTFIHEIGHALNCAHDWAEEDGGTYHPLVDGDDDEDDLNHYNVMMQNHFETWRTRFLMRGELNDDRNLGATEDIGRPRFSIESIEQMDLQNKLSVDNGRVLDLLGNYV